MSVSGQVSGKWWVSPKRPPNCGTPDNNPCPDILTIYHHEGTNRIARVTILNNGPGNINVQWTTAQGVNNDQFLFPNQSSTRTVIGALVQARNDDAKGTYIIED